MVPSSTVTTSILLVAALVANVSSAFVPLKNSSANGEVYEQQRKQYEFVKHHHEDEQPYGNDHGDTHDDGNDDTGDEFVLINVTEFVARVRGGIKQAKRIAKKYNLILIRRVFEKQNYFLFKRESITDSATSVHIDESGQEGPKRKRRNKPLRPRYRRSSQDPIDVERLKHDPTIEWIQEQVPKIRKKRDYVNFASNDYNFNSNIDMPTKSMEATGFKFNDPMWSKLWYINPEEKISNSMRIKEAWKRGFTGKGVVVTILDDGLEWDHPDLIKNYDFRASWDINENDSDPKPRYDRYNYNKHGTRCAGEIAAVADNQICSVGVAYNCRIGGIRMLDGEVTDLVEATALSYNRDYIDIYSASWGPDDDGKTVDGPGFLALKAIEDGIKYGRRGLGSIYVWASGNGGKDDDNCNCDGYTNSIYTISVSSATQNGNIPWYSEACSSTIASTFSSGSYDERQIITTDLRKSCTEAHTGTSASAPLAAGIIALTLESNPDLTWRDIQHIIVETAKPSNLSSPDWQLNGANRRVSHSFGYGLMDAAAMVDLAKTWTNVPPQRKCIIEYTQSGHHQKPIPIPKGDRLVIELHSTGCKGSKNEINFLEHVQAVITVQSNSRGTLVVYLRSPQGTNSTLLDKRILDQSSESFNKWPFTSVHMWGEVPQGTWILEIKNNAKNTSYLSLNLMLYGTKDSPQKRAVNPNVWSLAKFKEPEAPKETSTMPSSSSSSSTSASIGSSSLLDQRNKKAKLPSTADKNIENADDTPTAKQTDFKVDDPRLFSNGLDFLNQQNGTLWDKAVSGHSTAGKVHEKHQHHHHLEQQHEYSHQKHASGNLLSNTDGAETDNMHNNQLIDLKYFQAKIRTQTQHDKQLISESSLTSTQRPTDSTKKFGDQDVEAIANSEINLSNNEYDTDFYENQESEPASQFNHHPESDSDSDDYGRFYEPAGNNNDNNESGDDLLPTKSNSKSSPHQLLSPEPSSHFLNSILPSSSSSSVSVRLFAMFNALIILLVVCTSWLF